MSHAVSVTYTRFDHMSPAAALMAGLLHALIALALWWVSPLNHRDLEVEPIDVTLEEPAPQAPQTPAPPAAPSPQPSPPAPAAAAPTPPAPTPAAPTPPAAATPPPAAPPAARVAPPPQQAAPQLPLGLKPPSPAKPETAKPETPKSESPPPETQQASRPQETPLQDMLPPLETPPPPLTSQDFPKPPPKPAPPAPPQQQTRAAPAPSPPQHQQRLAPSPLSQHQNPTQQATAPSTTFVNPADTYARSKVRDDYLWQVIAKFSQYLPKLFQRNEGGTVVLTFSIARDGRLLDVNISKSSGVASLDRGLIEAIRAAAPYPPLPADIPGDHITYTQPITARQ